MKKNMKEKFLAMTLSLADKRQSLCAIKEEMDEAITIHARILQLTRYKTKCFQDQILHFDGGRECQTSEEREKVRCHLVTTINAPGVVTDRDLLKNQLDELNTLEQSLSDAEDQVRAFTEEYGNATKEIDDIYQSISKIGKSAIEAIADDIALTQSKLEDIDTALDSSTGESIASKAREVAELALARRDDAEAAAALGEIGESERRAASAELSDARKKAAEAEADIARQEAAKRGLLRKRESRETELAKLIAGKNEVIMALRTPALEHAEVALIELLTGPELRKAVGEINTLRAELNTANGSDNSFPELILKIEPPSLYVHKDINRYRIEVTGQAEPRERVLM